MNLFPSFLKKRDATNLQLRVMSALLLAPPALFAVSMGGILYAVAVACAVTIGVYEWLHIVSPKARIQTVSIACSMVLAVLMAGTLSSLPFAAGLGIVLTVLLYFISSVRDPENPAHWIAFSLPYMAGSGLALLALRSNPENGLGMILLLLGIVWSTDIGAYIAGRTIGGPKLAPRISPNKTWAGLIGGMVAATVLGYGIAYVLGAGRPEIVLLLAPVLAVVAQIGDLFESYFKRRGGIKESGDLIPGHGGILDRIDGLVFAAVFLFLFQTVLGESLLWF